MTGNASMQADEAPAIVAGRMAHDSLLTVSKQLARAQASPTDARAVHRLRVSTRRASAALDTFEPWLKPKKRAKAKRLLKDLRKTAGPKREADVHLGLFTGQMAEETVASSFSAGLALGLLIGRLVAERSALANDLKANLGAHDPDRLFALADRLSAPRRNVPTGAPTSLKALVGDQLGEPVKRVLSREEVASASFADLHKLRIDVKRVRYTVELCAPIFGESAAKAMIDHCKAVQDRLGAINDLHDMIDRVESHMQVVGEDLEGPVVDHATDGLVRIRDALLERRADQHGAFVSWWQDEALQLTRAHLRDLGVENGAAAPVHTEGQR